MNEIKAKRAPKLVPVNYAHGKIYKITNTKNDMLYIGSTSSTLSKRFATHKCTSKTSMYHIYMKIREIGIEHFRIILIENYPCQDKSQLEAREYEITNTFSKDKLYNSMFNGIYPVTDETRRIRSANMVGKVGAQSHHFSRGCIYMRKDSFCFQWDNNNVRLYKTFGFITKRTKQQAYMLCIDYRNTIYPLTNTDYFNELPFAEE